MDVHDTPARDLSAATARASTLTESVLDVMRWSASADLIDMTPGTVLARGATLTAKVSGLPLGTAGATVTYTGTYADGRVEINNITLSRSVPSCDDLGEEETATTVATLANTGGRSNRALALTAPARLIVGAGLAWSAMIRRNRNGAS